MIVVDTNIFSAAFSRPSKIQRDANAVAAVAFLRQAIVDDWPIVIPGIVFQETLSGIKTETQWIKLKNSLIGFRIHLAQVEDHELASKFRNQCLRVGIAASAVDCLIAAMTKRRNARLLSLDKDFHLMKSKANLPFELY